MTSQVRVDIPSSPTARTSEMRENFSVIRTELEALQNIVFSSIPENSPEFSGTASFENLESSGTAAFASLTPLNTAAPVITLAGPLSNNSGAGLRFRRYPDNRVWITGNLVFDYTNATPGQIYQIVAVGGLDLAVRPDTNWVVPSIIFGTSMYSALIYVGVNGSVYLGFAADRNAAIANVTAVGATLHANGCYPYVNPTP